MESGVILIKNRKNIKTILATSMLSMFWLPAAAQDLNPHASATSLFSNPVFIALLFIAIVLLLIILALAEVVKASGHQHAKQSKNKSNHMLNTILIIAGLSAVKPLSAQTQAVSVSASYFGMDGFTFYFMIGLIALELLIVWSLYSISIQLLGVEEKKELKKLQESKRVQQPSIIEKLNASVSLEKEADIMLDHDYDGIRELDNDLPPWWKYGFYLTIIVSVIYLIHFHVANTGKLQDKEYQDELSLAEAQLIEYKKNSANLVDENNAITLADESSISSGKNIFVENCAACHGRSGEGGVGPNLTDDYWMHQGGIKDIFKSIKYGWPEKGMKSWQQDLGAKQIHEVSSYIKSLAGTHPVNAKEKQGEFYKDTQDGGVKDSLHVIATDSTQALLK